MAERLYCHIVVTGGMGSWGESGLLGTEEAEQKATAGQCFGQGPQSILPFLLAPHGPSCGLRPVATGGREEQPCLGSILHLHPAKLFLRLQVF